MSPDHRYLAITRMGEAEATFLFVMKLDPSHATTHGIATLEKRAETYARRGIAPPGASFDCMDVDSFLWIPG